MEPHGDQHPGVRASRDDSIDLARLLQAVRARKSWILVPTLIAFLAALAFVTLVSPRYTAFTKVLLENEENYFTRPDKATLDLAAAYDDEAVQSEAEMVATADLARKAIAKLGLMEKTEFNPAISRLTALPVEDRNDRSKAQWRAFASMHVIAEARGGRFVSLLDPPDGLRTAAGSCKNQGWWPVLVGEEGERDTVLSSPIILYDYPKVAPESSRDLFDGTEIDEILTLRILAMTDDEKREMASVDSRVGALLERTHSLTSEDMARLHGTMREADLNAAPMFSCRRSMATAGRASPRL